MMKKARLIGRPISGCWHTEQVNQTLFGFFCVKYLHIYIRVIVIYIQWRIHVLHGTTISSISKYAVHLDAK
jgi:hypothetical protein